MVTWQLKKLIAKSSFIFQSGVYKVVSPPHPLEGIESSCCVRREEEEKREEGKGEKWEGGKGNQVSGNFIHF